MSEEAFKYVCGRLSAFRVYGRRGDSYPKERIFRTSNVVLLHDSFYPCG